MQSVASLDLECPLKILVLKTWSTVAVVRDSTSWQARGSWWFNFRKESHSLPLLFCLLAMKWAVFFCHKILPWCVAPLAEALELCGSFSSLCLEPWEKGLQGEHVYFCQCVCSEVPIHSGLLWPRHKSESSHWKRVIMGCCSSYGNQEAKQGQMRPKGRSWDQIKPLDPHGWLLSISTPSNFHALLIIL